MFPYLIWDITQILRRYNFKKIRKKLLMNYLLIDNMIPILLKNNDVVSHVACETQTTQHMESQDNSNKLFFLYHMVKKGKALYVIFYHLFRQLKGLDKPLYLLVLRDLNQSPSKWI